MPTIEDVYAEMEHLAKRYGKSGMQAIASLMHDMGSETMIQLADGTSLPCDFLMQHAWELGGTPDGDAALGEQAPGKEA